MTLDAFITKYLGKKIDWDGYYGGQCVDLYRQYVDEVLEFPQPRGIPGAKDFWTNYDTDPNLRDYYKKIVNTPSGIPQKGDVVIWNSKAGGGYGHVAIFIEGNVSTFTSFDQNWPTLDKCTKTNHDYTNVYGWLRPDLEDNEEELLDEIIKLNAEILKLNEKYKTLETKYVSEGKLAAEHIKNLQSTTTEQSNTIESLNQAISILENEKETLLGDSTRLAQELVDMTALKNTQQDKANRFEKKYNDLKEKLTQGLKSYSKWELFKQIFKK
jgi:uncharacterized coiled-coil protein SlyX